MKMSHRPTCLWSFLVLFLCTVNCDVHFMKVGENTRIYCKSYTANEEVSWTFKSQLIGRESKTGAPIKGVAPMAQRSQFSRGYLIIRNVEESDAGEYSCEVSRNTQKLSVMTYKCSAHPTGPSFQQEPVNIQCNVAGGNKFIWTCKSPSGRSYATSDSGSVKVTHVNISDGGNWQCSCNEKGQQLSYIVKITVIGLMPSPDLTVQEGTSVSLPCVPQSRPWSSLKPKEITWEKLGTKPSLFLTTESPKEGELKWKALWKSGDYKNVIFSTDNLNNNFSVALTNVKVSQTDSYRCSVKFDKEKVISHEVKLVVKSQDPAKGFHPGRGNDGSGFQSEANFILGIDMWIWIAIGVGCVVLIILIIIAVIVYKKKMRIKRKARKKRSMKHQLMPRDYCQCNRGEPGQPNGKQREHRRTSDARSSKDSKPAQQRNRERQGRVP